MSITSVNQSLSVSLSRAVCVSVCLYLASVQLLRNSVGENLLAVQTGRHHRGLETAGHDPHTETPPLLVAVGLSPPTSFDNHTLAHIFLYEHSLLSHLRTVV